MVNLIKKLRSDKKGQGGLGGLAPAVLALVVLAIIGSVGAIVLNDLGQDQTANSAARNATDNGQNAIDNVTQQMPLLGTVIVFAVIIAVVIGFFATRAARGRGV